MEYVVPQDTQTELSVLGGMMNDKGCLFEGLSELDVDYFTTDETRKAFQLIDNLSSSVHITAEVIKKKLDNHKERALVETADRSYKGVEVFKIDVETLKEIHISRQLYFTAQKTLQAVSNKENSRNVIEMIETSISKACYNDQGSNIIDPQEYAIEAYEQFCAAIDNPELKYGLRFSLEKNGQTLGFPGLDEVFMGAQGGDLFLIAAKTGEGKTALATNIARIFSLYQKYYGYYENTEMKVRELVERLLAPLANVTVKELSTGQIDGSKEQRELKIKRIGSAYDRYRQSHLYLSRIPSLTAQKAKGLAKQVQNRYGKLDYLIVDYLGRMEMSNMQGLQEYQVMFKITQQMKELAMTLDIPIFLLAQRNFDGNIEGAKKIANECDGVLFFEPITEGDEEYIEQTFTSPEKRQKVNYKITKRKVRRSDNMYPIYCQFDKQKQFINQVM